MVTRCFMRACLVVANIFGRVALSAPGAASECGGVYGIV